ncbi:putative C6 transcription factor [Aspergillus melleus]|uniref:putative C6 transcription factor n=1 Tax=Aspergillus melleus TaxID=138277 RepID=UPI001E8DE95B|nr:uncharacterized protein LDX57_002599 [Aspergillus melleus]KAH8424855.1 hypothetical protein LDX57_002599 [Aspergillus melleus]
MYPSPTSADRSEDDAGPFKKRTARACDSCYKRKIKCDAAVPQCNWCSHHNIPCTFDRVVRRKRKDKNNANNPQKSDRLAERIERIEKLLTDGLLRENTPREPPASSAPSNSPLSLPPTTPSPGNPSVSSSVPLHFAGREFGVVSLITGIPFLLPEGRQWVESRTGQKISFDKLCPSKPPWEKQRALSSNALLTSLQSHNVFELPDRHVVESRFDAYRWSLMQRVFPVLDCVLFIDTINAAYRSECLGGHSAPASVRACVFAFIAFSTFIQNPCFNPQGKELPSVDGEQNILKVQHLLPQILQEPTSREGLEALTMLALCELVAGNLQSANYYGSLAARMIFMLGSHAPPCPQTALGRLVDTKTRVQHQLRNLFWVCYTIEKDVCLRTGQPQLFTDENCDLTLPYGYVEKLYSSMEYHHHSMEIPESPIFPVDLRLSIIKSRAYSALYSFRSLKKTDAELLKEIRELDDELERWRMSVPQEWRPTLSFSHETPDPNVSMHSVMLRLNYHLCMTIIHQASSRCKSWGNRQGGMMDGVSSSLALSVEASRSTLLYLEAAEHVLVDGIFWTLIFYPMSAVLAIFCNILQNPSDPQATKDLGLLKTSTSMMERMILKQSYSFTEIVHIKLVADFVIELYRLANCAIEKAWNEQSV